MTRKELANRIDQFEKGNRVREWPLLAVWLGGLVGLFYFFARLQEISLPVALVGLAVMAIWLIAPIRYLNRINEKRARELGLTCPQCSLWMVGNIGKLIVATRHCSRCATKVVDESLSEQTDEPIKL